MSIQEFEAAYAKLEEQLQAAAKAKAKAKANAKASGPSGSTGIIRNDEDHMVWVLFQVFIFCHPFERLKSKYLMVSSRNEKKKVAIS